jgi:hypothetical protein
MVCGAMTDVRPEHFRGRHLLEPALVVAVSALAAIAAQLTGWMWMFAATGVVWGTSAILLVAWVEAHFGVFGRVMTWIMQRPAVQIGALLATGVTVPAAALLSHSMRLWVLVGPTWFVVLLLVWRVGRAHVGALDRLQRWASGLNQVFAESGLMLPASIVWLAILFVLPPPKGIAATSSLGVSLQVTVAVSAYLNRAMWSERERESVRGRLLRFGSIAPFAYPIGFFAQALTAFSGVTFLLASHNVVTFTQAEPDGSRIAGFYVWHFVDLVPLIDIPGTLRWSEPLRYSGLDVGALLLCFELLAVLPVIAIIRSFWHLREAKPDPPAGVGNSH